MPRDFKEDIPLEYLNIAIQSEKIKILVIGGGNAALIKTKGFIKTKAKVTILSEKFLEELENIDSVEKIRDSYDKKYLKGYHLIVICIDNKEILNKIREDCVLIDKLYLNCTDGKDGDFVIQSTISTKNINLGLNIKNKNPKGAIYLKKKIQKSLLEIDEFIEYTTTIRNTIKDRDDKKEILDFIHGDDFKYIFDKGKANYVLEMFFDNIIIR